ncbi:PAS domain S-box protein [Leptolyngbya sp. FACHB-261]|uniref:PAS domain-containing hybrid sensor histidine kinase/response regulator n=1 Tax=Leptolyngbya sp. FACHB-261 TaxID=2692806 RepID=UPI001684A1A5|nr:PAS domain S-box protein [Leptolyngbya sp. FACHB-261]MBD2103149.1 PAS domain S-box protein [Leptolyngbya sp. FACHB-261]
MLRLIRSQLLQSGIAVLTVGLALLLTLLLQRLLDLTTFALFYTAVAVSTGYGGLRSALLAIGLSTLATLCFVVAPDAGLAGLSQLRLTDWVRLGLFVLVTLLLSLLNARARRGQQRSQASLKSLQLSEERYRRIIDTAYEGIWAFDAQGYTEYVNQRLAQMLGYRVEEMLGRSIFDFMDEAVQPQAQRNLKRRQQGIREQFDFRYRHKDGSDFWAIVSSNPILSSSGEFLGVLAMLTDVTERKQAEDALRASEARFRCVVESNIIGINFSDSKGYITDANDAFLAIVGYSRAELCSGKVQWAAITPQEHLQLDERAQREIERTGAFRPFEKEFVRKDGSRVPVLIGGARLETSSSLTVCFTLNLTERKRAETALRESQKLFQNFMSNIPATAFIKDEAGRYLYVNRLAEHLFNRPAGEWLGKTDFDFFPSETAQQVRDNDLAALAGEQAIERLETSRSEDGEHYWLSFKFPMQDALGRRLLAGTSINITQQKRAEAEREHLLKQWQDERRLLQAVLQQMPAGVMLAEAPSGRLILGNDQVEQIWRRSFLAATGVEQYSVYPGFHDDGQPYHPDEWPLSRSIQRGEVVLGEEITILRGDGTYATLHVNSAPIRDQEGQIVAGVVTFYDISERKQIEQALQRVQAELEQRVEARTAELQTVNTSLEQRIAEQIRAEQALRRSEERFRSYFELPLIGIAITSLEKGWIEVNDKLCEFFGYSRSELMRMTWVELTHPEDMEADVAQFNRVLSGEQEGYSIDKRFIRKDGTAVYASISTRCLRNLDGSIDYFVALVQDITQRKAAEAEIQTLNAQLEQRINERTAQLEAANQQKDQLLVREQAARREAEAANRLKDEFLSVLSHEIRTPLNGMLGWAQLLRRGRLNPDTTARALETIERNARAQAQLIDDLLDVSRIIQGQLRLEIQPCNLSSVLETAIETIRPTAEAKQITLSYQRQAEVLLVRGDASRLQQVVWNLLSNAVKFTPQGGWVEVRLGRLASQVQIQVQDTGIGIPSEFLPFVFDRFRQADSATTRNHGGLGLGLAIVRHLVELHGGTVAVDSAGPGQGTTFSVQLPCLATTQPAQLAQPEPELSLSYDKAPSLSGLRVLVVDDEADARDLLVTALTVNGAEVIAAASVVEALSALKRVPPDILLSDIGMPNEDGYALIHKVRALELGQGGKIPAVALTAYTRKQDRERALQAGFQSHLAKPVNPTELVELIASLTGRATSQH